MLGIASDAFFLNITWYIVCSTLVVSFHITDPQPLKYMFECSEIPFVIQSYMPLETCFWGLLSLNTGTMGKILQSHEWKDQLVTTFLWVLTTIMSSRGEMGLIKWVWDETRISVLHEKLGYSARRWSALKTATLSVRSTWFTLSAVAISHNLSQVVSILLQ